MTRSRLLDDVNSVIPPLLAHEIRNPLTTIKGFIQLQYERNQESHSQLILMLEEIKHIEDTLTSWLSMNELMKDSTSQVVHVDDLFHKTHTTSSIRLRSDHIRFLKVQVNLGQVQALFRLLFQRGTQIDVNSSKNKRWIVINACLQSMDIDQCRMGWQWQYILEIMFRNRISWDGKTAPDGMTTTVELNIPAANIE